MILTIKRRFWISHPSAFEKTRHWRKMFQTEVVKLDKLILVMPATNAVNEFIFI